MADGITKEFPAALLSEFRRTGVPHRWNRARKTKRPHHDLGN